MQRVAKRFSGKSLSWYGFFLVFYLFWITIYVGFRTDHLYFILFLTLLYFLSEITHKLIIGLVFFIVFWVLYDGMRVIPNYDVNPVSIKELYDYEKALFGFNYQGVRLTPNEYFVRENSPVLDFISGCFYILWMPAPIAFGIYLFFKDKLTLYHYTSVFLLANLIGFTVYYLYPAAPPWYVEFYGFEENFDIPGNPGFLIKFDEMIGIPLYHNMYSKNANVFAAVPSMHSAFPFILLYFGIKNKYKKLTICFVILTFGIWFAAVYSLHHYIIDVILGVICAIFAILLFEKAILKTRFKQQITRFAEYIQ